MVIRDYIAGDEQKIIELFKLAFNKELSPEYWNWRFIRNPLNKIQIKLMFDNEKLVGHYAVSPMELLIDGKKVQSALSMTTMTHPEYTGKGIFTQLASDLYSTCFSKGELSVVYGFPNANSHYGFINKLGWKDIKLIPTLSCMNVESNLSTDVTQILKFEPKHHEAYLNSVKNYSVALNRTAAWFNWRYLNNPSGNYIAYEMRSGNDSGFIVGKLFNAGNETQLDICELVSSEPKVTAGPLISALINHFKENKINKINTWIPDEDNRKPVLADLGFIESEPKTQLGWLCMDKTLSNLSKGFYFSMGDSDIY